nr:CD48 antigen isoform X2 [Danio rerio]|eukprot:XP_021334477.1 CD48 antigen isoform X2 [Danio rerio]
MRRLCGVLNLFICLILSRFNAVTSTIYIENGRTLTLNVTIQGNPEEILWKFNGNKLAERDLTDFQDYGQFKGRSRINITSGQLTVRNATRRDSGTYESEIQISGKLQMSKHEVRVIDAVQKPSVSCKVNKTTESTTLRCSVPDPQSVSYRWTTEQSDSDQHLGPQLQISSDQQSDSVYTCTVSNPVSWSNTSVTLRACGTDNSVLKNILIGLLVITALIIMIAVIICLLQRSTGLTYAARKIRIRRTPKTTNTHHAERQEQAFVNLKKKEKQYINNDDYDDEEEDDKPDDEHDERSNENRTNHDKSDSVWAL